MSLEDQIQGQYSNRKNLEALYNSEYSKLADREKILKIKKLVGKYLPEPGSVLEIGAGQGHNVPILRDCGFKKIVLNELLPDRIAMARTSYPDLTIFPGNAINLKITERFDCVFQSTVFTSILSDADRKALGNKMWEVLKPGGIILWYDFIYNNPSNPDVKKVSISEVRHLFSEARKSEIHKVTLAPPIGRRVGKLYTLFNVPLLRSHILAVFQK